MRIVRHNLLSGVDFSLSRRREPIYPTLETKLQSLKLKITFSIGIWYYTNVSTIP